MNNQKELQARIDFIIRVIDKEFKHLDYSASKLFLSSFTVELAERLISDEALAERVEAFSSRFSRLQDNIGDKLLPLWLSLVGEKRSSFIDNLNKAEKLELLSSAEQWMLLRQLRNKMVHEYIEDAKILADALNTAFENIEFVKQFYCNLKQDILSRNSEL